MNRLRVAVILLFAAAAIAAAPVRAQGCSQCRESVGQTPPRVQTAYRRGILLLVVAGGMVFAGAIVAFRRFP